MEGLYTLAGLRAWYTDSRDTVLHWYSICAWISAKVVIKGAVLLHDHHHVFYLLSSIVERGSTR
jgi:hypothetical protein